MRIPLVVYLAPLALAIACSDQGPIQNVGPKLTISPATVSVETGSDPITLQAVAQNGDPDRERDLERAQRQRRVLGQSNGRPTPSPPRTSAAPEAPW